MRTALLEDVLSMIPAMVLLIALHFEQKDPTRSYNGGSTGFRASPFSSPRSHLRV